MCNLKPLIITINLIFIIFVIYDHIQINDNNLKKCKSLASKEEINIIMFAVCLWLIILCLITVEIFDCFQEKFRIFHVNQAVKICLIKHFIMTSLIPFKTLTSCGIREKNKWIVDFLNNRLQILLFLLCFISMIIGNITFLIYNKINFEKNQNEYNTTDSDKKFQWKYVINIVWYITNSIFIVISLTAWFFCFSLDWFSLFLFNLTIYFQFVLLIFDMFWINFNKCCTCNFKGRSP